MTMTSPRTADLLPREHAERLGVLADSHDRFDLMRAIERCDELARQLHAIQIVHSQNLCRIAGRLAADNECLRTRVTADAEYRVGGELEGRCRCTSLDCQCAGACIEHLAGDEPDGICRDCG